MDLNPSPEIWKTNQKISVFPTGANGNIGDTGPGWRLGSGVWGWSRQDRAVWGSGPRGAAPLGWYHQKVTLYNICSLEPHRTQPRPATAALLPRHALHLGREHQHGLKDHRGTETEKKQRKSVGSESERVITLTTNQMMIILQMQVMVMTRNIQVIRAKNITFLEMPRGK